VDKLYVNKVVIIVKIVMKTVLKIDQRKQDEKKGLLVQLILLDLLKQFAGQKQDVVIYSSLNMSYLSFNPVSL
jgi:hypothetical protein